jgi:hypothetical protein
MKIKYYALWLSLVCIIVFIFQLAFPGFTDLFVLNSSLPYEIWRFISSIFLHGSLSHIISNLFALALFGTVLESIIGSRRFLIVFFVSGIIANLIAINFYPLSLGVSGAIYGILGALIILRPMMVVWVYSLPMPMFIAGIVWVGVGVLGLFAPSGVGDIAHLSGIAIGFIFGIYYRTKISKYLGNIKRNKIIIDENSVRRWEDIYVK